MSSNPGDHLDATPRFSPPESAQPQGSLFGGPSNQDVDLEPYAEAKLEGDEEGQDDYDVMMRELPPIDNDLSDDESYRASDEAPGSDDAAGDRDANEGQPEREATTELPQAITRDQSSPPPSSSSSSSPQYRPNRFRGQASTWRHLTAGNRMNSEALETARSRDLAAHLYNAFALRERARAIASGNSGRTKRQDEAEFLDPGKLWTAWPMSASEVPRVDEHLRRQEGDGWTLRMQPDMRPSAELEETIIAIILKTAKDRFETRERMSTDAAGREGKEEAASFGGNEGNGKVKSDPDSLDGPQFRPVVQADDDKSRRQLRPLTRNILTQFDDLLMGLHDARRGTMVMGDSSASEWQSDTESSVSRMSSRSKSQGKPRRSQSRGRKRARRSTSHASTNRSRSKSAGVSMESASSRETSESRSRDSSLPRGRSTGSKASTSRARLGLRDWSEVLGVASMTGWPSGVVSRTAQRCAGLFGQDMAFQTFKEGRVDQIPGDDGPKWEYIASESDGERESIPPPPTRRPARSRSRGPSTHREPTPGEFSLAPEEEHVVPRLKGKGEHRKQDLICPIKTCSRHKKGFTRRWNLNQHMKRMHPNYRPSKPGGIPPISVPTMDD